MPLVLGGPPEWIWERTADFLKWEVVPVRGPEGHTYEVRASCGVEILGLQSFTPEELRELAARIAGLG
jgi:hypothetical protein